MTIDLSIVICCYNKVNFTISALNDLFLLPQDTHELILIDNASTDTTQEEMLKIKRDNFIYIRNETNLFHSGGCNQGYKVSAGKNVLFINNDIRVKSNHNNWTEEIIKNCSSSVVGPTMGLLDDKFNFVKEANEQLKGNVYISGWCIASSKENWNVIEKTYGSIWDEKYPLYFNDAKLGYNCEKLGITKKIISLPINHFGKISTRQLNVPKLYTEARKIFIEDLEKQI
jgi:GT2 family glycosyltransferase